MDSKSSDGRSGRSNQNRSRGGQPRGSRQGGAERFPRPEPTPTIGQKILGFLGIGKQEEPPAREPEARPPAGADRSTGAQARKRVRKTQGGPSGSSSSSERVPVTGNRLHVGNLNYDSSGEDLTGLFGEAGTVVSAEIVTNPHSGRSKGFAFVEMSSTEEASEVAEKFHGQDFMGRDLVISGAKSKGPREGDRPPRDRSRSRDRDGDGEREPRPRRERDDDRPPRERKSRAEREQRNRGGSPPEGVERFDQAPKKTNVPKVSGSSLKVENLDPAILEGDLRGIFGGIGTIVSHEISSGSATVELSSIDEAQRAVEVLDGKQFMGRELKVSEAKGGAPAAAESEPATPAEDAPAEESVTEPIEPKAEPAAEEAPEPAAEEAASEASEESAPEAAPAAEEAATEEKPASE